jgi:hypothetical protein
VHVKLRGGIITSSGWEKKKKIGDHAMPKPNFWFWHHIP